MLISIRSTSRENKQRNIICHWGQARIREKIIQGVEPHQKGKSTLAQKVPPIHD